MSGDIKCECCGRTGFRRRGFYAPEGWLYLETTVDDDADDPVVVSVCSSQCGAKLWQTSKRYGPGPIEVAELDVKRLRRAVRRSIRVLEFNAADHPPRLINDDRGERAREALAALRALGQTSSEGADDEAEEA